MTERINPHDIPPVILGHIDTLRALLRPLHPGRDSGGYLTTHEVDGQTEDTFTELGWALADNAARVAADACLHLSRTVGHMLPDTPGYRILQDLHYDAAHNLAMVERALGGIQGSAYPVGVTQAAWTFLEHFRERCEAAEEVVRDLERAEEVGTRVPTADDGEGSDMQDPHAAVHAAGKGLVTVGDGLLAANTGDLEMLELLRDRSMKAGRLMWSIESETPRAAYPTGWREITDTLYSLGPIVMAAEHAIEDPDAPVVPPSSERWYVVASAARTAGREMTEWAEKHMAEEVAHA